MSILLNYITKILRNIFPMLSAAALFLCYYILNRNAVYKESNKSLEENMKEMNIESKKIFSLQKKEMDIASRPAPSRDAILQWMRSGKGDPK